jgi:hypothetical protein
LAYYELQIKKVKQKREQFISWSLLSGKLRKRGNLKL